jgi:hypothetical protein
VIAELQQAVRLVIFLAEEADAEETVVTVFGGKIMKTQVLLVQMLL